MEDESEVEVKEEGKGESKGEKEEIGDGRKGKRWE